LSFFLLSSFFSLSNESHAFQAIENIRTVTSLGRQLTFVEDYNLALQAPEKKGLKNAYVCFPSFSASNIGCSNWSISKHRGAESDLDLQK